MKQKIAGHVLLASLGLAFTMGSSNVWAQAAANYPDKPVKVIIPCLLYTSDAADE